MLFPSIHPRSIPNLERGSHCVFVGCQREIFVTELWAWLPALRPSSVSSLPKVYWALAQPNSASDSLQTAAENLPFLSAIDQWNTPREWRKKLVISVQRDDSSIKTSSNGGHMPEHVEQQKSQHLLRFGSKQGVDVIVTLPFLESDSF